MGETDLVVSHVGICTSDLDRSSQFYIEALGFALERYVDIGEPFDILTEVPGLKGRAGFFQKGGVRIELAAYEKPETFGPTVRRPMNQLGVTHLSFVVANLESVCQRIEQFGGRVHRETKVESAFGPLIFCDDPDGVRLELWQRKEGPQS